MREIKFRAWDKERKYMKYDDIYPDAKRDWAGWEQSFDVMLHVMQMDFELMQFTGLKDKNGVEIFEGDVIKDDNSSFKVEWKFAKWHFQRIGGAYQSPSEYSNASRMEIIGNIYENPELLKESVQ